MTFDFDVCVSTNDDVKEGTLCLHHANVQVEADRFEEAELLAAQIAGCHGMVTQTRVRI